LPFTEEEVLPHSFPYRRSALVLVAALGLAAGGIARADVADRRHDVQHELERARAEAAEAGHVAGLLNSRIAADSDRIDALESAIGARANELATLEAELQRSRARLDMLARALEAKKRELARARRQLTVGQHRLAARLVEIYTSPEPDAMSILLGADSLEGAIEAVEARERVLALDDAIVAQVSATRERLSRERARAAALKREQAATTKRIAVRMAERRAAYTALVASRQSLVALRARRERSLAAVEVERDEWEAQADALAAESRRLARLITAAQPPEPTTAPTPSTEPTTAPPPPPAPANAPPPPPTPAPAPPSDGETAAPPPPPPPPAPASPASSSGFIWPVRGTVVSPFGQRWGRLHAGIDIAAPAGTPIVASASGSVIYSGAMSGYGNIVVIQHGAIATAYAHNSSNAVPVGQTVSQGATIAYVGCTGSCSGNHVHFEVRVNGSPVDPMGYL
jgi:murein DD-endopeptidase MepM/ murein hydrolase activator NlpD